MSGIGAAGNKDAVTNLLQEMGVAKNNLLLATDAALALALIPGNGAILIAGTGSICLGKKDNNHYRVGGLGYILGDEGSGYTIGLEALKAALAEEYGWGQPTSLTPELRKLYGVSELKIIMQRLYKKEITSAHIGRAAPVVLAQAVAGDTQAISIVHNAAIQLCDLVTRMVTISDLYDGEVHLWGGLFKSTGADTFINTIQQHPVITAHRISIINQARHNTATLFAQNGGVFDESPCLVWQAMCQRLAS
jgi:N-acetylglucosamine kinase-like BadF-type ATPase